MIKIHYIFNLLNIIVSLMNHTNINNYMPFRVTFLSFDFKILTNNYKSTTNIITDLSGKKLVQP